MRCRAPLAFALLLLASGCGEPDEPGPSPSGDQQAMAVMGEYLEMAQAGGGGQHQIEVLEEAARTGALTYDDVVVLVQETFSCMDEAGIGHALHPAWERVPGWRVIAYSFDAEVPGLTEDQVSALAEECMDRHSKYAEFALHDTRLVQELRDNYMREQLPTILTCLEDNGVTIEPEATLDEIRRAVFDLMVATSQGPDPKECYEDV